MERPFKPYPMLVAFSADDRTWIEQQAKQEDLPMAAIIRRCVKAAIQGSKRERMQAAE